MRKHLSGESLLRRVRSVFSRIKDPLSGNVHYSLTDCLMSGLAIFSQKYPSLLQFDSERADDIICHNLQRLYGITKVPCDTTLRKRLDELEPSALEKAYKTCFNAVQPRYCHYFIFIKGMFWYHKMAQECFIRTKSIVNTAERNIIERAVLAIITK